MSGFFLTFEVYKTSKVYAPSQENGRKYLSYTAAGEIEELTRFPLPRARPVNAQNAILGQRSLLCIQSANGTISGEKTGWQAWAILVLVRRLIRYRGRFNSRYCVPVALPDHIARSRKTCQVHLFGS
ncbi:hypothetical protein LZF95_05575 [Algoriphagus sp. AGSA1]|uniref:hypothetical protein n=1 Tax=Algoriphagus sp. AGSA1 TaxID=2907213 RepID=UPI001F23D8F5|nr:hypothetical protein [Algoriphagus sp. AGSA1]MCE7054136.1 hypothetical protein [Algoriphagus sp. AGSA1]